VKNKQNLVDSVRITTPCTVAWESMSGDERTRHCLSCDLKVYNFAAMARDEVNDLLARAEGRVCGRMGRRADGTIVTKKRNASVRTARRRLRLSARAIAAMLTLAALVSGCATHVPRNRSTIALETERAATAQPAAFAGVVLEDGDAGAPLPGVTVTLRNTVDGREIALVTDGHGAFEVRSLDEGVYRVEVTLDSLFLPLVQFVPLRANETTRARVSLRIDPTVTVLVGAVATYTETTKEPFTTTFTEDLLKNLPH
jgi:hypothetical protein